eukprot:TRINITY_DN388_c0_g1_i3.p1 TRINITY_DN388_c0_g1~~TRINITY_DN388_c0_g1_i3.p1  ORF type:complete len:241 (-),score=35.46 TRINITY_DN388_c0_g1_i3:129-851(-)
MTERVDKVNVYLRDSLNVGCLRGFTYFSLYPRVREELLVNIPLTPGNTTTTESFRRFGVISPTFDSSNESEEFNDPGSVVFLIGCYARYKHPYVWARSNLQTLSTLNVDPRLKTSTSREVPLELPSTSSWKDQSIRVWHIIAELVSFTLPVEAHTNLFKIDYAHFESMSPLEGSLAAASMAAFLKRIYLSNDRTADSVLKDLQWVISFHFNNVPLPKSINTTNQTLTQSHTTQTSIQNKT